MSNALLEAPIAKKSLNLTLHCGGRKATEDEVAAVVTPKPTESHVPIPHTELLDEVFVGLNATGYRVVQRAHALAKDGQRYFGLAEIQPEVALGSADYGLVLGIRNSHDKAFAASLVIGAQVFICDNLSLSGEVRIDRKHSTHIRRDLPSIVTRCCGRLQEKYVQDEKRFDAYKNTAVSSRDAHDLIIRSLDGGAICSQQVQKVLREYREPSHPEFDQQTIWGLFNAFTEVQKGGGIFSLPRRSASLHGILDSYCGINPLALSN